MSLSKPLCELQSDDLCKLSDEELMQHATSGRHDALAILFDRYHRLVFDVALRIVRDPGEAEDVVQNVFLDVFRAMANFDSRKGILKVWVDELGLGYFTILALGVRVHSRKRSPTTSSDPLRLCPCL